MSARPQISPDTPAETPGIPRRLRADAERNRAAILAAARDVFAEQGLEAPLEEIAARAGVGIATLYRRFPDRAAISSRGASSPCSANTSRAAARMAADRT